MLCYGEWIVLVVEINKVIEIVNINVEKVVLICKILFLVKWLWNSLISVMINKLMWYYKVIIFSNGIFNIFFYFKK